MSIFIVVLLLDLVAWSEQASCSVGKYLYEGLCIPCTPGYYCSNGETQTRYPRDLIAPGYGFSGCQQCPLGWYSTYDAQETCLVCPQVNIHDVHQVTSTYTNSSYCFQCPMGYSCLDPAQFPKLCPAGTYQSKIMSTSCTTCPSEHKCGSTTNLLACSTTSCVQAEPWTCDQNQHSPSLSVCTNIS